MATMFSPVHALCLPSNYSPECVLHTCRVFRSEGECPPQGRVSFSGGDGGDAAFQTSVNPLAGTAPPPPKTESPLQQKFALHPRL